MNGTASTGFRVMSEVVDGDVHVVSVAGELDVATVSTFRSVLAQAADEGAKRLVVDLSRSAFVDSVGVGAILHAKRRLGEGARMALVVPERSYAGLIFDVVGADALVDVFATRTEAVEHVT